MAKKLYVVWYVYAGFPESYPFFEGDSYGLEQGLWYLENRNSSYLVVYDEYERLFQIPRILQDQYYGVYVKLSEKGEDGYVYRDCGLTYWQAPHTKLNHRESVELLESLM